MAKFFLKLLVNTLALLVVAYTLPGVYVDSLMTALVAALVFGLINAFLKPLIILITLPINILSLGILTFFINGLLFYLVSELVAGFGVSGFSSAFWGALIFSIVSFVLNFWIGGGKGRGSRIYFNRPPERKYRNPRFKDAIDVEVVDNNTDNGE